MGRWFRRGRLLGLWSVSACMVIVGGCGPSSTPRGGAPDALHDDAITVASFDFPESRLLAEVYGAALERGGIKVEFARDLGPRELVDPALARGLVELVPEYAGTALEFLSLGDAQPSADVVATHEALRRSLHGGNMVALAPAPAQTANAIVVTRTTATRHGLATISDLAAIAPDLTFGGPPECLHRPFCLEGLQNTYDLEFAEFLPLDTGGPLTLDALNDSVVDVALLFSTEPRIASDDLVELTDDRALQPAENVTPFVHRSAIRRFGPELVGLIDAISATLTTAELRTLNGRVANGESPSAVAHDWVAERGRS